MKTYTILIFLVISLCAFSQTEPVDENGSVPDKIVIDVSLNDGETIAPVLKYPILDISSVKGYDRRRIYFIHGLSGDEASWTHAASAFQTKSLNRLGFMARECRTKRIDYSLSVMLDLYTAADKVRQDINSQSATDDTDDDMASSDRAFIIAHSQGGAVSRALLDADFITDPPSSSSSIHYGGLVTVSSPLQGAQILNNMPLLLNMADDACRSLSAGPAAELTTIDPLTGLILKPLVRRFVNYSCEALSHDLLPLLFADKQSPITNHYKVGSAQIATLNSNATNSAINSSYNKLPKIAFYGYEPGTNLFWRTANWMTKSPNSVSNVWDANNDYDLLLSTLIPLRNKYVAKVSKYNNKISQWRSWGFFLFPVNLYLIRKNKIRRDGFKKGLSWMDNRADIQWKTVIGARKVTRNAMFRCNCRDPYDPLNGAIVDDYVTCLDEGCAATAVSYISTVETKPSDGVVLTESSMNLPGATNAPVKIQGEKLPDGSYSGSSHMQIRNDKGIKDGFIRLLDGNYGQFFFTEEK